MTLVPGYYLSLSHSVVELYITDNFQRSFFVSDGNALTLNAYVVGRKYQQTTINVLLAISDDSQRFKGAQA